MSLFEKLHVAHVQHHEQPLFLMSPTEGTDRRRTCVRQGHATVLCRGSYWKLRDSCCTSSAVTK